MPVTDTTTQTAGTGGVVDSAKQSASNVVDQVKDQASQVVDRVKDQATTRADQQRQTLASGFRSVAQAFHGMGEDLRDREESPGGQYGSKVGHAAAAQVEKLANYLEGRDVRQVIRDVENAARRSPAMFLGGAFLVGLLASRFLKSSRPVPDFTADYPDPNRALPAPGGTAAGSPEIWRRGEGL